MTIIQFQLREKLPDPMPRQKVFYLGFRYAGPMLCQEVQHLYLKRKGNKNNSRKWAMITYGKYDECDSRVYSLELDECEENDVPDMLAEWDMEEVTFDELKKMGWNGKVLHKAKVYHLSKKNLL
tara:strand:+ start:92 stop:463 length:372 start_codon:yes stop_codon:yes gene_type:complete